MRIGTRWKKRKVTPFKNERLYHEELNYFRILKVWDCKEYRAGSLANDGSHWLVATKALVLTETGLKYTVPFLWILFSAKKEDGRELWRT